MWFDDASLLWSLVSFDLSRWQQVASHWTWVGPDLWGSGFWMCRYCQVNTWWWRLVFFLCVFLMMIFVFFLFLWFLVGSKKTWLCGRDTENDDQYFFRLCWWWGDDIFGCESPDTQDGFNVCLLKSNCVYPYSSGKNSCHVSSLRQKNIRIALNRLRILQVEGKSTWESWESCCRKSYQPHQKVDW